MHATIDANQPSKSLPATVSFVIAMLLAAVAWAVVGLIALVYIPKVSDMLRDFGIRGSTLTRFSLKFSEWANGQQPGQGLPGSVIGLVVILLVFAGLGFLSVRRRKLAAGLAAILAVVGGLLTLVLFIGTLDGTAQLTESLQNTSPS